MSQGGERKGKSKTPVKGQGGAYAGKSKGNAYAGKSKGGPTSRKDGPKKEVSKKVATPKRKEDGTIRLNKYIANSGMCSRREADMYISIGNVTVNGKIVNEMGYRVKLEDDVRFDGRRINPEPKTYLLLNKPKGFATTVSNDKGNTVMDLIAKATTARVKPIGRLGRNSTGLILFTNDDEVVQKFTNSKNGVTKLYHIELSKNLKVADMDRIREGMTVEGKKVEVVEVSFVEGAPKKEIGLKLKHRGNSVIRTIFEHLNYEVLRIDCVGIAGLTKKDLPRGNYRHLTKQEVVNLTML